jgi:tRNA(Ile)-lysidine synthase
MKGLRGMDFRFLPNEWSEEIPLVRPLLDFSKTDILDYCTRNNLEPAFDQTNNDLTYFRNKLRKELVPYLESYNRGIRQRLLDMAHVLRFEDDYLQQITSNTMAGIVTDSGSGYFVLNKTKLSKLHPAIIRRILLTIMKRLNPESGNISFDSVEKALNFIKEPSQSSKTELAAHLEMYRYMKGFLLFTDGRQFPDELWPQVIPKEETLLRQGSTVPLNGRWYLTVNEELLAVKNNRWNAKLDATKITNLKLSSFKNGDTFSPLGMGGKVLKLGDYWTNKGLPLKARENWPLIRSDEDVVWVPGFTISENYKITDSTQKSISIKLTK